MFKIDYFEIVKQKLEFVSLCLMVSKEDTELKKSLSSFLCYFFKVNYQRHRSNLTGIGHSFVSQLAKLNLLDVIGISDSVWKCKNPSKLCLALKNNCYVILLRNGRYIFLTASALLKVRSFQIHIKSCRFYLALLRQLETALNQNKALKRNMCQNGFLFWPRV